ncbi:MAG: L,D-transpeptidase family protein [Simplicispira sp.]|nr:L,D-transpeptidase family protein [Simplicispira sp.]
MAARVAVAATAVGITGAVAATGAVALAAKKPTPATPHSEDAEASLLSVYRLIGQGRNRQALALAQALVHDHPNFQLAQLVYGDLLNSQVRPVRTLGDVHPDAARTGAEALADLREESHLRLKALRERPPPGTLPSQFMTLAPSSRHAIAIDISRSRLYLFENSATGLRLAADFYISIGKLGAEKTIEGDKRTPLGIYFITSNLDPKSLKDFYGSGALPINYPNALDQSRGKTGGGIWLHGTPPEQFSRAPRASDGCVVLANPDLEHLLRTVQVRTTPVVIAQKLQWQAPQTVARNSEGFATTLADWQKAKSSGDLQRLLNFYTPDFRSQDKTLVQWTPVLRQEMDRVQGRPIVLKDVSYLQWTDSADTMVVTFGEVIEGMRTGSTKRQYWIRQGVQWKIFFEGVIG